MTSQIKEVTVFLNGAQVKRTASRTIPSGTHYLKFTGLSTQIDPNSIQVNGRGSATILSVSH
ncbi:MAG: DUF4140 domain-containing protein, partial [Bacteroidota bacterium]